MNFFPLWKPTQEERNIAFLQQPADLMQVSPVTDAPLPDRVAIATDDRVWALPGPGATLHGLGAMLQERVLNRLPNWTSLQQPNDLARLGAALFRVARRLDASVSEPLSQSLATSYWLIGTLFPLPIWRVPGNPVHVAAKAIADSFNDVGDLGFTNAGEYLAATVHARPLDQLDPFNITAPIHGAALVEHAKAESQRLRDAATAAATPAQATALGTTWGARARWNPYAALFPTLETMKPYAADPASGLGEAFATAFHASFTAAERALLASTSAGYALIRCLWRTTQAGRSPAGLAQLLGTTTANTALVGDYPAHPGTLEPPVAGGKTDDTLPTGTTKLKSPNQLMGFGRLVPFKVAGYQGDYRGIAWDGEVPTVQVLAPAPPGTPVDIDPSLVSDPARRVQWARILAAISRTEGLADAVTSWDSAVVSLGFQQWSLHIDNSAPALLARLKKLDLVAYDAVVRSAGVDAGPDAAPSDTGTTAATLLDPAILWRLRPQAAGGVGGPRRLPATKVKGDMAKRHDIALGLDWTKVGTIWVIGTTSARFSSRWAVAARFVPAIWRAQAEMAYKGILALRDRLDSNDVKAILNGASIKPKLPTPTPTLFDLFASEAAVASLLDHSVNLPGDVPHAIRIALERALAAYTRDHGNVARATLDAELLLRIFVAQQYARRFNSQDHVVDVANARVWQLTGVWDYDSANPPQYASLTQHFNWP